MSTSFLRHLGLDLGTTNSCVCYTHFNEAGEEFNDPEPVRFGRTPSVRSLLLLDEKGQQVIGVGEDVYKNPDYLRHPERVHEEFKMALGETPDAVWWMELLCRQLLEGVKRLFHLSDSLPSEEFRTTVGAPARWVQEEPERLALVQQAATEAGFPNVAVVPEPVAAMLYHAFLGDIRFERRAQRWLVIDFGGGTTDLALVETAEGGEQPRVIATSGRPYGGKEFDRLLLEQHILPHYWEGDPPDPFQALELLRHTRKFKEQFSEALLKGHDRHSAPLRTKGVRSLVELTRAEFESDEMAGPLLNRFAQILLDGFRNSGFGMRDVDRVILTGGSARWYFVRQAAKDLFGPGAVLVSENPELAISKGLALAHTGFKLPIASTALVPVVNKEALPVVTDRVDTIMQSASIVEVSHLDLHQCRRQSTALVNKYMLGGSSMALLLSPIPGVSQIPLTLVETRLVNEIARIYGYSLKGEELTAVVGGLLAGGTVVKIAVMEAATFVPGVGWAIKAGTAGGAIKVLGELTVRFFEERRQKELSVGGKEQ